MITTFAFVAAYEAAMKAGEALEVSTKAFALETTMTLAISVCIDDKHDIPRASYYVFEGVNPGPKTKYEIMYSPPVGRQVDFVPVGFEFENLGRIAILDIVAGLLLDEQHVEIPLGSIGKERSAHVALYFDWQSLQRPIVTWISPAKTGNQPLEFRPLRPAVIEKAFAATASAMEDATEPKKWQVAFVDLREEPEDESKAG